MQPVSLASRGTLCEREFIDGSWGKEPGTLRVRVAAGWVCSVSNNRGRRRRGEEERQQQARRRSVGVCVVEHPIHHRSAWSVRSVATCYYRQPGAKLLSVRVFYSAPAAWAWNQTADRRTDDPAHVSADAITGWTHTAAPPAAPIAQVSSCYRGRSASFQ